MIDFQRAAFVGVAALALMAGPAFAQSDPSGGAAAQEPATTTAPSGDLPANASPTPTEPAATETPERPAAAGGEASDATDSGAPASSASPEDMSGTQSPDNPRNAVGDKFELPRYKGEDQINMIAGICGVQIRHMTQAACRCLAERSMDALSDPQRDYMIASVVAPPVADRMLKDGRITDADQKTIFAFIDPTSDACASEHPEGPAGANGGTPAAPSNTPAEPAPGGGATSGNPSK